MLANQQILGADGEGSRNGPLYLQGVFPALEWPPDQAEGKTRREQAGESRSAGRGGGQSSRPARQHGRGRNTEFRQEIGTRWMLLRHQDGG